MSGIEHRGDGSVRLCTTGDDYLLQAGAGRPTVTLGRDVDVQPIGDGFRLTSPHVQGEGIIGPGTTVSGDFGTLDLRDEVATLTGHPRGGVDSTTAIPNFWRRQAGGSR